MAIKKGALIPQDHHVMRYVPWARLRKNEDDEVIGILGKAFQMRDADDDLSATWLEYFQGFRDEQINAAVRALRAEFKPGPKAKSGFAIGKVRDIQAACMDRNGKNVRIVYDPVPANEAHVAVKSIPRDDDELLELLATEAWADLRLNQAIPP